MAADATSGDVLLRRTPREVFDDHLRLAVEGTVEEDLRRNYAEHVVILTTTGIHHGHDGVRRLSDQLREALPNCTYHYQTRRHRR